MAYYDYDDYVTDEKETKQLSQTKKSKYDEHEELYRRCQEHASFLQNMLSEYLQANGIWESDYLEMIGTTFNHDKDTVLGEFDFKCFILTNRNDVVVEDVDFADFEKWNLSR